MGDESNPFENWLDDLSDPAIMSTLEAILGASVVERAQPALSVLVSTNVALRGVALGTIKGVSTAGALAGAEVARPVAAVARPAVEAAIREVVTPLAPDALVARLGTLDQFLAAAATPAGARDLQAAVGAEGAKQAIAAATTLVALDKDVREKLLAGAQGTTLQRVTTGFGVFDEFAAKVGDAQALGALEAALGAQAAEQARAAARTLLAVGGRLRALEGDPAKPA